MEIKNKLTVTRGESGKGIIGESRGMVKSSVLYKQPTDNDNGVGGLGGERIERGNRGG